VFGHYNPNVVVIPNFIHEDLLGRERPSWAPGRVTVGWAGGLTHLQDIALLQQPLKELRRTTSGYDLHFLGQDYRPLFAQEGRFTPWQPNVWDYYRAIDFDIGVVPLADTPFNRCRTPIKALEYAALGIPVLASDVEPYRGFVVDGVTGYLCRTETDWRSRLRELVNDPQQRAEMGAKAREVAAGHTIQQGWQRWAAAYEGVCGS
jgi:glycosyltransferase involved in cell wall biosynthesis